MTRLRAALYPDAARPGGLLRAPAARACGAGDPPRRLARAQRRAAAGGLRILRQPRLAGTHAAESRSVQPVPVHVQPLDLVGLRAARPRDGGDAARPGQGPADHQAVAAAALRRARRRALLRLAARDRAEQRAQALPRRHDRAGDAVPRLAQRRHRDRGGPRQQHPRAGRGTDPPAQVPAGGAPRVRGVAACRDPPRARGPVRAARERCLRAARAARLHDSLRARLAAGPAAAGRPLDTDGSARAGRGGGPVRGHPGGRRAGPPPDEASMRASSASSATPRTTRTRPRSR